MAAKDKTMPREALALYTAYTDRQLRERILETARNLLSATGSADISMRDLVGRAQTNNAAVYRLFGSKDMIFREILVDEMSKLVRRTKRLKSKDSLDHLFKVIRLASKIYFETSSFMRAASGCLFTSSEDLYKSINEGGIKLWLEFLKPLVDDGFLDPDIELGVLSQIMLTSHISAIRLHLVYDLSETKFNAHFAYNVSAACCAQATPKGAGRLREMLKNYEAELVNNIGH